jgi:DNA-binding PadR family transcriptional regulator
VLSIIIQRPSYVYEVAARFHSRFGTAIQISDQRVYAVVADLRRDGLVEELPFSEAELARRQPRRHVRATAAGLRVHREWPAAAIREDPDRASMQVAILAASLQDRAGTLELIDRYEASVLSDLASVRVGDDIQTELIARERRMVLDARLRWVAYARERLSGTP